MAVRKKTTKWYIVIPLACVIVGFGLTAYRVNTISYEDPLRPTQFGVTFSTLYAKQLGLDWQQAYTAVLDDLQVRRLRIPVYWNEIESERGTLQLDDVQWMLDEAAARDAHIILAIGQRVPRWPECHPPTWTKSMNQEAVEIEELNMMEQVVNRFSDHPALVLWQVQNEPFFSVFGECPTPNDAFLESSVDLVRQLDPFHPIMITASGELSTWFAPAQLADVVGISMYRVTWNSLWGYFYYPLPAAHYAEKAKLIAPYVDDVIVTELQGEPWVPTSILDTSLDEQFHSMSLRRFQQNVLFARRTGFHEVYVWGVEWWYWLWVQQNNESFWNEARSIFSLQD